MNVRNFQEESREMGCLPFTKIVREIRLETEWNTTFWIVPAENLQEQRNI